MAIVTAAPIGSARALAWSRGVLAWQAAAAGAFAILLMRPFDVPDPFGLGFSFAWTAVCACAACAIVVPQAVLGRWPSTRLDVPLLAYVAIALLGLAAGVDRGNTLVWLASLAGNIGIFFGVVCVARAFRGGADAWLCFLLAAITLLLLMATAYHAEVGMLARPKAYPVPEGWSGYPELAMLGAVHVALLVAAIQTQKRATAAAAAVLLPCSLAAVTLLYSRGAWIAIAAVVTAGLLMAQQGKARRLVLSILIMAALGGVLVSRDATLRYLLSGGEGTVVAGHQIDVASPEMRFQLWKRTIRMIGDHPWAGVGLGNFQQVFETIYNPELNSDGRRGVHAHNAWLQQFAEVGIPGGLAYLALWIAVFRLAWIRARRDRDFAAVAVLLSLTAVAATNLTTNMFFMTGGGSGRLHSLAWVLFGLVAGATQSSLDNRNSVQSSVDNHQSPMSLWRSS
jgi:O-antigen ligase